MARIATVRAGGTRVWGAVVDGGFIALSPDYPQWSGLRQVIEAGALAEVAAATTGRSITHADGQFTYDIPVTDPEKIICVGVNFPDRNAEYKDGQDAPRI